ncbi:MAG: glycosyl hydrolase family 28-related protein, partial [Myxococcaceae bacterium]
HDSAFVGNVLRGGSVYQTTPSSPNGTPIYQLGNNFQSQHGSWDNGYSAAHIYRDANWDSVSGRIVWASGARTIPPSLYLGARPAFFGSNPWPWVDPLTGTVSTLPAKARYDAGRPNVVP